MESRMREIRTYGLMRGEVAPAATPRRGSLLYNHTLQANSAEKRSPKERRFAEKCRNFSPRGV